MTLKRIIEYFHVTLSEESDISSQRLVTTKREKD